MCEAAPAIIDLLDRMGVMFNRTPEGLLDFRRFGGTLFHRTAFAGATTGQQLLYALDEQVRRYESEGKVKKFEGWTFLSAVLDDGGVCRGICAMDLKTMEIKTFPCDAAIFCTGGIGAVFGRSTNSVVCTGSAQSALFQQGVYYANGEFIQVHPTAIPGEDKCRLMSESARGEGGRVWVPKTPQDPRPAKQIPEDERFYFLEEWYPKYGNLVPRDVATRAIHKVVYEMKMGLAGEPAVYLDVTHIPREVLERKLEGILEIYEKFVGVDPCTEPMKVFPAMHYTMGGLWVDNENQATNVAGNLCGRRMRIPVSRRESPRREFAGFLHLRRRHCRSRRRALRAQPGTGLRIHRARRLRARTSSPAGYFRRAAESAYRHGKSARDLARNGRHHDRERHRDPL